VVRGRPERPTIAAIAAELAARRCRRGDGDDPEAWRAAAAAWGRRADATAELAAAVDAAVAMGDVATADEARRIVERAGIGSVGPAGPVGDTGAGQLTKREREVLDLVVGGATNRQVAAALYISEKTASVHVSRILGKLGVASRRDAATVVRSSRPV
jgi:DNA-binding NarL/FixJ family response regulator